MSSFVRTIKIAGPAGLGIKSGGQLFSKVLIAHGFNIRDYNEYPSLVRGGHNTYQTSFSQNYIFAPHYYLDSFFSIRPGHWQSHLNEFNSKTLIFSDEIPPRDFSRGIFLNLPLQDLVEQVGNPLVFNTICLGVAAYLYQLDKNLTSSIISTQYQKYSDINLQAFNLGYDFAQKNYSPYQTKLNFPKKTNNANQLFDGNESFGWGFIKGGGNFYAAYPMTPSTGLLHFLAEKQQDYKITVIHPEDEISAANLTAGAVYAGARGGVGTSGGGFALMTETVSFCGVTEIGMIFYLVSRPGPATGLATWTSQGDLLYVINSGHGEFPKVVLAPGDHNESFEFGVTSLNLAAELQTPVLVLSDKYLGESSANCSDFSMSSKKVKIGKIIKTVPSNYLRYSWEHQDGVSPYTLPGTLSGEFLANSYEHDQYGFSTENGDTAARMLQKRLKKYRLALRLCPKPLIFGHPKAKKLIVSWGSTKGPILESLSPDFAFLQIRTLWPIDPKIKKIISKYKKIIVVENNQTSQLTTLLKSQFDFQPDHQILKFDGRPFFPEELSEKIKNLKF